MFASAMNIKLKGRGAELVPSPFFIFPARARKKSGKMVKNK